MINLCVDDETKYQLVDYGDRLQHVVDMAEDKHELQVRRTLGGQEAAKRGLRGD